MNAGIHSPLRLILASTDRVEATRAAAYFEHQGWEVHRTGSGVEARRLTHAVRPDAVILDTNLPDETGWLTCAKLRLAKPTQKIVLVGSDERELSAFVGASALVSRPEIFSAL